ncbi:NYN domain-containing protein [Dehalococcoides mccartyi]|jgi:hypothetical protein|uniref:NYN domain-containing protein n=1 Tax=Dehalococcoides mccartyi TaxID=61435 RepID=UPI0009C234A7|nr:NYN domain-containing protein [Dehalococcoides mccartyi]AQU06119.1 hypothetical protein B1777_05390 [Dehalococcoides mccartyi]AQU07562.1 hypothetical protein B1778_05190 [Dehalococcoides mccartyi]
MPRLAIFIDGGYLDKIAEHEFHIHIDYTKLSEEIRKIISLSAQDNIELLRTFYYHCLPYQGNPPTPEEASRFSKKQSFFNNIGKLPRFSVREGRLAYRGNDDKGKPIFVQKKVDLQLGLDFALISGKRQITHVVVIAGDGDLLPAFHVAKEEAILVWLFHGPKLSKRDGYSTYDYDLWKEADERYEIDLPFMQRIQRL